MKYQIMYINRITHFEFKYIIVFVLFTCLQQITIAQNNPVLFSVEDREVRVDEFEYIYTKNNGDEADYSRASLQEYLDLYVKFKLKVQKAFDMGLDTVPELQQELETYRRQLANSYLTDKEVMNKLIDEAYGRIQHDVKVAHILAQIRGQKSPRDSAAARNKINEVLRQLEQGASFEEMARLNSDDRNSAENGGVLGYVTAMLPDGFYHLETAAYETKVGEISDPVLSKLGYHLVKVLDKRPARGEMEIGHIFLRKPKDQDQQAVVASRMDSLYQALQQGARFDQLARQFSQDNKTNSRGGYIGKLVINQYAENFEETAFALENDGDFSAPVESNVGWHIIQRISKQAPRSQEQMQSILKAKIENDGRNEIAKDRIISKIIEEADFSENRSNYNYFKSLLDSSFLTFRWKTPTNLRDEPLFAFGSTHSFSTSDLNQFLFKNTRQRVRMAYNSSIDEVLAQMYQEFIKESALKYEENNLKAKYPEFRNLMREYEEGILLFEATKIEVWDKAAQDTTGLNEFFQNNRHLFMWEERAEVQTITLNTQEQKLIDKIIKQAKKKPLSKVVSQFNKKTADLIKTDASLVSQDQLEEGLTWEAGSISTLTKNLKEGTSSFMMVSKINPPAQKSLNESRGYVIAEYQNFLEKHWVDQLREEYDITINQDVFDALVKK